MAGSTEKPVSALPRQPIKKLLAPVKKFLHVEAASGVVLLIFTIIALVLANSSAADWFKSLWKTPIEFKFGNFEIKDTFVHLIINDGLMTIFFFVVGLEVKREIVFGELRSVKKAMLPVLAAIGGMVGPALVYLSLQYGQPGQRGWAIPMATDIAFVVGFLALFGKRVPFGLKIFLLSLAIADDIGAVLIIAFVFTDALAWDWLLVAASGFGVTYGLNRLGVRQVNVYVVVGAVIWLAFLKSGVHPTVAGVLLGLLTPASAWVGDKAFLEVLEETWRRVSARVANGGDRLEKEVRELEQLSFAARETISPLHRLELALHPWVAFVIMPLFAFANAGVKLEPAALAEPVAVAVALGLFIGKPLGIFLISYVAVKAGLTALPRGVSWKLLAGGGCLAGIGFTMALFLNGLAFPVAEYPQKEAAGKIGTLAGSLASVIVGAILIYLATTSPASQPDTNQPSEEDDHLDEPAESAQSEPAKVEG